MEHPGEELDGYHLLHAARADLLRRLGRDAEAAAAYPGHSSSPRSPPSGRLLEQRLTEVERAASP